MAAKTTPKTLAMVLLKFAAWAISQPPEQQRITCRDLDRLLDEMAAFDAFGTEGQCDPRGDQRN